ncbi:MAG: hypothetical protein COB50_04435 [Thiotrichales bacterium]|nr:MAG: hypothetical protein COB50_04435 [Thiotrichales bacterium]
MYCAIAQYTLSSSAASYRDFRYAVQKNGINNVAYAAIYLEEQKGQGQKTYTIKALHNNKIVAATEFTLEDNKIYYTPKANQKAKKELVAFIDNEGEITPNLWDDWNDRVRNFLKN